jgi:hypothetical protein
MTPIIFGARSVCSSTGHDGLKDASDAGTGSRGVIQRVEFRVRLGSIEFCQKRLPDIGGIEFGDDVMASATVGGEENTSAPMSPRGLADTLA